MARIDVGPETWSIVDRLLEQALDLPDSEREAWLDGLLPEHRIHVDTLRDLLSRAKAQSLYTSPRLDLGPEPEWPAAGARVGAYRLLRRIGEGGMGTVWLAERTDIMTARPLALKLPRSSWPCTLLAERLEHEREILAALDHPHIARLFDAGIAGDGQPYLALEYVEGRTIDVHVRDERLGLRARLELFLQVCDAIAHAHGRMVVHRDLKPSNILVTRDGQARLVDFGIAKLLETEAAAETELTLQSGRIFTPSYASPEQIGGEPNGTSSDIYSLGVVLYELLAGVPPYRLEREVHGSFLAALCAADIARPSQVASEPELGRALRGDLDSIILKAMRLRPDERYATANAFADDLRRHLSGHPVQARADGAAYRFSKLVRRHRAATLAICAVLVAVVAVVAGVSAALWQARVARYEARRAEAVKELFADIFRDANPYQGSARPLGAVELLLSAKRRLDRDASAGPEMRLELLNLIGGGLADLKEYEKADGVLKEATELAERALPRDHRQALIARVERLDSLRVGGRAAEAALAATLAIHPETHPQVINAPATHGAALALVDRPRAGAQLAARELPEALESSERGLAIIAAEVQPESTIYASFLAGRGQVHLAARRPELALAPLTAAAATLRKTVGQDHEKNWSAEVGAAHALLLLGRLDEADALLARLAQAVPAEAAQNTALYARGIGKRLAGDAAAALVLERAALLSIAERPSKRRLRMRVLTEIALDLVDLGRTDEAGGALDEALPLYAELETRTSPEGADARVAEARRRMALGHPAEALPLLEEAERFWNELSPDSRWSGEASLWLARCQAALGHAAESSVTLARARKILTASPFPADAAFSRER